MSHSRTNLLKRPLPDEMPFVETQSVKDLLCYIARGIAPYADAMRRYGVTDKDIDMFTTETLAAASSVHPLQMKTVERYFQKAETVRSRAKTLFEWAAEAYGRPPRAVDNILDFQCLVGDLHEVAARIRQSQQDRLSDRKIRSWYELCETRLKAFASIVISSTDIDATDYDAYAFLHKTLCGLSGDKSLFELAALSQLIDKETLKLVNLAVSGGTLVDVPQTGGPVKASIIVSITEEPVARVMRDRV